MVVDGYVELTHNDGKWTRIIDERHGLDKQPLSIPDAVEKARRVWRIMNGWAHVATFGIRVIDTAGVVVEQWPKR